MLAVILIILGLLVVSFLITSGIVWVVCWAFSLVFTWKIAIAIWLTLALARTVFQVVVKNE